MVKYKTGMRMFWIGVILVMGGSVNSFAENLEIPSGLWRMGDGTYFSKYALIVDKSKKKVFVIANTPKGPVIETSFDSDLGKNAGDKRFAGDRKTPEGIYFFKQMLEGNGLDPKLYGVRAFVTDYPNFWDRQFQKRGSGIWLHAIDDKVGLERGSKGCVVVRNDSILKLSEFISLSLTPMIIYDSIPWITPENNKIASERVFRFLERWKKSWETEDFENYSHLYSDDFKGNRKMTKPQWIEFKKGLAAARDKIEVTLTMPAIYEHNGNLIVRFLQDYKSSAHEDFGEKVLFLRRLSSDDFSIVGEEWQPAVQVSRSILANAKLCCSTTN